MSSIVSELGNSSGMNDDQWQRIRSIFDDAASLPLDERGDFLRAQCREDDLLLTEVQSLLEAFDSEEITARRFLANGSTIPTESRLIGPYRLEELLGRGGMGAVYLAHRVDGEFHQQVAIKLIDLPFATEFHRDQFRTERQILAGLNHSYIARLLDGGVSNHGELYLVMEYVNGIPILRYCREAKLSLHSRLLLFRKVCSAVQYAHQNLVIHRDLKSDNILVAADGTPQLVDFGTAKLLSTQKENSDGELTRRGIRSFTPQYASPEQILGKPMSTASDTYSLGVLLFHLVADLPPFELKEFSTEEMLRVVCNKEPPRPSAVAISAEPPDEDLDSIVLKAMRKEPEERYLTVAQLDADIQAWLEHRPVMARRGTWRYRISKFARRNSLALVALCFLLASILCGAAGVFWQWRVATRERGAAETTAREMRDLSNSFLSEIDAAVRDLPGSTPVRQLMVSRVLQHLDNLAENTRGDRATQLYLADAYMRLGRLQGNPYEQNLGDAPGAFASLNKALAIVNSLRATSSGDTALLELRGRILETRSAVFVDKGATDDALVDLRNAIAIFSEIANTNLATAEQLINAGEAYHHLGDLLGEPTTSNAGDYPGALNAYKQARDLYQRALRLDPDNARSQYEIAMYPMKTGHILLLANPSEAINMFRQSKALWNAMPLKDRSSKNTQRTIRYNDILIALSYDYLLDFPNALAQARQLEAETGDLARKDPKNAQAWEDSSYVLEIEGETYIDMLNPLLNSRAATDRSQNLANAIAAEARCVGDMKTLATFDPENVEWAALLAHHLVQLGLLKQMQHPGSEGSQLVAAGVALLRHHVPSETKSSMALRLAASAMLEVTSPGLRDPDLTVQYAERLTALSRRLDPNDLLLLAQAYHESGQLSKAIETAREGLSLLPPRAPGARPIRCRILLQGVIDHAQSL